MNGRYAHSRQLKRAKKKQKSLRTYLGRVIRDMERKLEAHPGWMKRFAKSLTMTKHIHVQ
jgi:IS5 family transposase